MSCTVLSQPKPLATGPIVVACNAPVKAPVPIPIPASIPASITAHTPEPEPPLMSAVTAQCTERLTVPVRPAFNWRNAADRLREGLHRPLPFESDKVPRYRQSVFHEMGLGRGGEKGFDMNDFDMDDMDDMDEILPRARRPRPASLFLTNLHALRLGLDDDNQPAMTSPVASARKRMSWSPASSTSASPSTSTSTSPGLSDRKRPWYAKLGGSGSGGLRLAPKRSILFLSVREDK
ncbi:hypothetical protein SPBR_04440 [Sporothrix brasiliensis 5110]|uniref:Uncharacterized protein n=1 Tax=Sporothrix brasiliensis 5110 TaxID=1398154 RepID=A0A0C2FRQ5_9PEZI|nr:uncharacterized protein SPBR_04440 [Sporothrix brasiliensis 5110]KIH93658.1 hypothetical protein SPBR_04440 [Sporothrix brasiliensis 5110]